MKREYQIFIIIGVVFGLYLYIYFNFLLFPTNKKISVMRQSINEKKAKLDETYALAESLPWLQQETKMLELEIVELEKKLPKEANLPIVFKIISRDADVCGIRIDSFRLNPVDTSPPQFNELPIDISFSTSFHSLGQFLTILAQGERIIASQNIVVSYTGDKKFPLSGNCRLLGYSLK